MRGYTILRCQVPEAMNIKEQNQNASMTSRITALKESLNEALHNPEYQWTPLMAWAENKTGVNRLYLFMGFVVFMALYLVFGYAGQLISNCVGFLYPAYRSMKALETSTKDDDVKWLTYWVVFAFFSTFEYFSDTLLYWIPFYWLFKCLFYIWCFVPLEGNGSVVIYQRIIRPRFLRHQQQVDNVLDLADTVKATAYKAAGLATPEFLKKDS